MEVPSCKYEIMMTWPADDLNLTKTAANLIQYPLKWTWSATHISAQSPLRDVCTQKMFRNMSSVKILCGVRYSKLNV